MPPSIHLFGLPTDVNSSFDRGPATAPAAIRSALWSDRGNLSTLSGLEIGTDVQLVDQSDLPLTEVTADDDRLIAAHVASCHAAGAVPIALGGDHAVSLPLVAAAFARHGPVNILHIDAHPDTYDDFAGNPRSHASPFARIMEAGYAARLVQVGIRTLTRHCDDQARRFGIEMLPMLDFQASAVPVIGAPLYISIDMDGIDPSFAPGVNHPEPGGVSVRELLALLHRQRAPIVGVDIVELNPERDINGVTAILAALLVRECAALIHRNAVASQENSE